MREIVDILPRPTFSSKEKRSREKLEEAVMKLPAPQRALLERAAITKVYGSSASGSAEVDRGSISPANANEDEFFETVSEECRRNRISKFIDATGNKAIAMGTCAVCAGSFFLPEICEVKVSDRWDASSQVTGIITHGCKWHRILQRVSFLLWGLEAEEDSCNVTRLPERILVARFFLVHYGPAQCSGK